MSEKAQQYESSEPNLSGSQKNLCLFRVKKVSVKPPQSPYTLLRGISIALFNFDVRRSVYILPNVFAVLFALPDAFGEEIFNLTVYGAEIVLSPSGKGIIELFRYS